MSLISKQYRHLHWYSICCFGYTIEPEEHHPAVPKDDVEKMNSFIEQGLPFEEAHPQLRRTHFPANYDPHPWKTGKSNSLNYSKHPNIQTMYNFKVPADQVLIYQVLSEK